MREKFFNIRYVFGKENVWHEIDSVIDRGGKGYVVVADGVVVNTAQRMAEYRKCLQDSLFAICDSGWVPVYIKRIYGLERDQYCGPMIFKDFVERRKHRQFFMGTNQQTLDALRGELSKLNPDVNDMTFYALPFMDVQDFDYEGIARMIEEDGADIIWVALGAPKQCYFMQRLLPFLKKGVMLGVGAAFNFYSGTAEKRAPEWMCKNHMEFIYRIMQNPRKQINRCWWIVRTLPSMMKMEKAKKHVADTVMNTLEKYTAALNGNASHEAVNNAANKVQEAIYEYSESQCRDKMNEYWFGVIDAALDALEAVEKHHVNDTHMNKLLKDYATAMISLVDKSPVSTRLFDRAASLGIV